MFLWFMLKKRQIAVIGTRFSAVRTVLVYLFVFCFYAKGDYLRTAMIPNYCTAVQTFSLLPQYAVMKSKHVF